MTTTMTTCTVCFDDVVLVGAECGHACCAECWSLFLNDAISNGALKLLCFAAGCNSELSQTFVRAAVSPAMFEKHSRFLVQHMVERDPGSRFCPKCGEGLTGCRETQFWTCVNEACKHCFCNACMKSQRAHGRKGRCERFRLFLSAEETQAELFEKFKVREAACGQHVVSCPACAIQFQKISGCNHITCVNPSCRKEFCYLCGGDYYDSEGNYHFDGRSICTSSMTMDEYRQQQGLQENATPLMQPDAHVPPVRARAKLSKKAVIVIATSPLWVPLLPVLLPAAGACWACATVHETIKKRRRAKSLAERRARAVISGPVPAPMVPVM